MKRKAIALAIILALAFTCISCIILIGTVESQSFETIYIRADGSVEGTNKIQMKGNIYTLTDDIFGTIEVEKDFIIIDGSGYVLKGSGESGSSQIGLSLFNRKNVTVTNLGLKDYFFGISCRPGEDTTTNITIWGNYIQNCDIGIEFQGTANNFVKYNTFENNGIDISILYVFGDNLITYNNLNDYVQVWRSYQLTMDMNFWADYDGIDSDGDGIGDSPYFYHDLLQDNHPLMKPIVIYTSPEPTPTSSPDISPLPTPTLTTSPEPTPTPPNMGPTSPPSQENLLTQEQSIILGLAILVAVICAGLGLLLYKIKKK